MANECWKMRGSYKSPLPIARDRELLVDMNNGDVYFGWNGSNVPLSNVAELQTLVGLLLGKKILALDEDFVGKAKYCLRINRAESGYELAAVDRGESAYEAWLNIGNTGTEAEFVASLKGDPGAPGTPGASIAWRGAWNDSTNYVALDGVTYGGSSWRAVAASTGQAPSEGVYWTILAEKGADGADGQDGAPGAAGQDGADGVGIPTGGTAGQLVAKTESGTGWVEGVLSTVLTGLSTATNAAIAATDTVLAALGKLQAQITGIKGQKVLFSLCVYPNADLTSATVAIPFAMTVDTITIAGRTASNATKAPSASTNAVLYKNGSALDTRAFTTADTSVTGLSVSLAAGLYDLRLSAVNGYTDATDKVTVTWSGVRA